MADEEQANYETGRPQDRFCCGEPMKLIKFVPRIGPYPELQTYQCDQCHNVETIEVEWKGFHLKRS